MNRLKPLLDKAFLINFLLAKPLLHKASTIFVQQRHLKNLLVCKLACKNPECRLLK